MKNGPTILKLAYERGFRVTKEGDLISSTGRKCKLKLNSRGYYICNFSVRRLKNCNRVQPLFVHRLQAYSKFGEDLFEFGIVVRHLNGNKLDNSWNNIAIGTQSDNLMDIPVEIRKSIALNAASYTRKLTEGEVISLRKDRKDGMKYKDLRCKYNLAKSTISCIVNRKTYSWVV